MQRQLDVLKRSSLSIARNEFGDQIAIKKVQSILEPIADQRHNVSTNLKIAKEESMLNCYYENRFNLNDLSGGQVIINREVMKKRISRDSK